MHRLILSMLCLIVSYQHSFAQEYTETINRTLTFSPNSNAYVVFVENINGAVEIEPSNNDDVQLNAILTITGDSEKEVAQGKQEIQLISKVLKDTILIYVQCPAINYYRHDSKRRYNYNNSRVDYSFNTDIKLKIPEKALADVSTINEGDVEFKNFLGTVKASNVNGNIYIEKAREVLSATTVNGEIRVESRVPPTEDAKFKTINGDIYLNYPENISANLKFKSFNGEFYTDYTINKYLPTQVNKSSKKGKSTTYKLEGYTIVQIGNGGPELHLETLNGDAYVGSKKL